MPLDLDEMLAPAHTAVLTMELQRRIVGDSTDVVAEIGPSPHTFGFLTTRLASDEVAAAWTDRAKG